VEAREKRKIRRLASKILDSVEGKRDASIFQGTNCQAILIECVPCPGCSSSVLNVAASPASSLLLGRTHKKWKKNFRPTGEESSDLLGFPVVKVEKAVMIFGNGGNESEAFSAPRGQQYVPLLA
jgi:hypothetical protein